MTLLKRPRTAQRAAGGSLTLIILAVATACSGTDGGDTPDAPSNDTARDCLNAAQMSTAGNTQRTTHTMRQGSQTAIEVV
jgi:hypothetical protein